MNDRHRIGPSWPAPAKLNLFLHVVGRRPDGMHLLQTVFQFLDVCDELEFRPRDDGRIRHLNPLPGVAPESDLTVRAARLLQEHTAAAGCDIRIDKRLPLGGGLGGGSSDCATTLVALNHLWELGLSADDLAELGLRLGADVPVFVRGRAAWAEGIGEQLTPVDPDEPWYVIIRPDCEVATGRVFADPDLTRSTPPTTIRAVLDEAWRERGGAHNDCEPVVRRLYPPVAEVLDWLTRYAPARLTGTGACVFAGFDTRTDAEAVVAAVPDRWQGFIARGRNRSPLLDRLEQAIAA